MTEDILRFWLFGMFAACGVTALLGYIAVAGRVWRHLGPFFTSADPMFEGFELGVRLTCTVAWPAWLALRVAAQVVVVTVTFVWYRGVRGLLNLAARPFVAAWRMWGGEKPVPPVPGREVQAPLPEARVLNLRRDGK